MTPHILPALVICPNCRKPAQEAMTRYGSRHDCCNMHSWGGKPLASPEVHSARQRFHKVFDRLWQTAETVYRIEEEPGTPKYDRAVKRIRKAARGRAYLYMAAATGLPEPECHGATQDDLSKLERLTAAAKGCPDAAFVRDWWMASAVRVAAE